jgi:metal-responsive CopG/Arc/MetJ family transcriptional regulator
VDNKTTQPTVTKMLGGLVPEKLYWEFKAVATERRENMSEAIYNAAQLYIGLKTDKEEEQKDAGDTK